MPAVAALALTLALAPAPTPSASGGPVGDLIGDLGQVVDGLLTGGGRGSPSASPTPVPSGSPAAPTRPAGPSAAPAVPSPASPARSAAAPGRDRPAAGPVERPVEPPAPDGQGGATGAPSSLGAPPRGDDGAGPDPWLVTGLALGALAVPVLLVWSRRRRPAAGPVGPVGPANPTPDPDEEPLDDNVIRLPTSLNAIYELGRLDERLSQERDRRS
ncbi:hypothetical protein [Micromonospora sp. CPCC 205561]|uniref:hypothetical protein n=1 Tax=Micromonospora sp. CPCC 205561 TaxID=3122407 RepID=UPI002FF29D95